MEVLMDVVGIQDIAARLGVKAGTANSWRARSKTAVTRVPFPEPDGLLSGSVPYWYWGTVEEWARETGRL